MTVQTLADLMTWNVIDIDPASPLGHAAAVMERAHISSLLVTRGQEAVGILTERDLLHALHKALPVETPVSMVMSSPVLSASADTPVLEAYHLIASRDVRHLLVVDERGEPTGIVSESDFRFHMGSLLLNRLRDVRSVMMPGVPALPRDARLSDAVALMEREHVTCVTVVDDGHPVGMVTERDIARLYGAEVERRDPPITDIMTWPVETISEDATPHHALERMQALRLRHLVVVDDGGRVAGLLTEHSLVGQLDALYVEQSLRSMRQVEASLEVSEARRQAIWQQSPELLALLTPDGVLIDCNPAAALLIGRESAELAGHPFDQLPWWTHDEHQQQRLRLAITRAAAGQTDGFEATHHAHHGSRIHVSFRLHPVRDSSNQVRWLMAHGLDITSQVRAREALAEKHAQVIESQELLRHQAHYDTLTHLPNRVLMADRMQQAMARARRDNSLLALCYLDLDGFKPINDTLGHDTGDHLLAEIATRLASSMRAGDTVARLGGDEFALLIVDIDGMAELGHICERVLALLAEPMTIADHTLSVSASMGVTLFPQDGADADTLLRHADHAMYSAKQSGRNRYHLFDADQDRRLRDHQEIIASLEKALQQEEFELHYQPKVSLRSGDVVGAEALLRWRHPKRGLLDPREFLAFIEACDLALPVGRWVIDQALTQLDAWRQVGLDLEMNINISPRHLQHPDFLADLKAALAAHPAVPARRLELEIVETAALHDMARVGDIIAHCQSLGLRFALDDFGTGYSSLAYFKRLPARTLKIDQSFIADMLDNPEDAAIVEGIIGLTSAFRRDVVAEGIESPCQGALLLQLGCDLAQGFGIARPMPAAALPDWISGFRPDPTWAQAAAQRWRREDLPLLVVGIDHKRWINDLDNALDNPALELEVQDYAKPAHGRFGQWYYGLAQELYGDWDEFSKLGGLHEAACRLAARIVDARQHGDAKPARRDLWPQLLMLRDELLACLARLQAKVSAPRPVAPTGVSHPVASPGAMH